MSRKILLQVAAPPVVIGFLLFVTSLVSAWYINRLQGNMANVVAANVASLQAAHRLEISLRQVRFHSLAYLTSPSPERLELIRKANQSFEEAIQLARASSSSPQEEACVRQIEEGYRGYREELDQMVARTEAGGPAADFAHLAENHAIRPLLDPCHELSRFNEEATNASTIRNHTVSRQVQLGLLLLGLVGPLSGLIIGYGMARGLSRSIYRLNLRLQDAAQQLEEEVGSVRLPADGDLGKLDKAIEHVVRRVAEVAERWQRQQRELLRAEHLAAVGQLAAGVAHEVRNPLTGIKMLIQAARRDTNPRPLTAEDLRVIHGEIGRMEQTVQGFLDFARPPAPRRLAGDWREVVSHAAELVRARARQQHVETVTACPARPLDGVFDRGQMCTVLVNLFLNALDAMPRGGTLEVRLEEPPGGGVRLAVADTGTGIDADVRDRLFTPFVSSKPTGTGLGLSICRRIVEEHGGRISAADRPGGGACFTIRLPARPPVPA
jgi:signal transduction histidine kinase